TARALHVSATGVNKVYDGTTTASVTLSDDRVAGDSLTDSYTGASFSDKNVGTGKAVSVSGISISGADAGNYTLQNTSGSTTADITARVPAGSTTTVTVSNATYDGSAHGGSASWVSDRADAEGAELTVSYVGVNGTVYASSVAPTDAGDYRASASFAGDAN